MGFPTAEQHNANAADEEPQERNLRREYADWPQKGDDRAQPWDHEGLGVDSVDLEPGERNTVTPTVRHHYPVLGSGSSDPSVAELGRRLAVLGYPNSVSKGENPFNVVDSSLLNAVERFRGQYGVEEDPEPYGGPTANGRALAAAHVGPWTWEGLIRASDRAERDQDDQTEQ